MFSPSPKSRGAPSLVQMARRMCIKVVREINDVGLARYDVIRPVLQKIENPHHLHELEQRSPHLLEHDAELWIDFIKRDIYFWEELDLSEPPESWYDFYVALQKEAARKVDEDAERMRQALQGLNREKSKNTLKVVDPKAMRLPREKPTSIQRYAHHDRIMGGIQPVFALNTKSNENSICKPWEDNSRWKLIPPKLNTKPGSSAGRKSALPAAVKRNSKLFTPTHKLNTMASRVTKAPKSLIEYKPAAPMTRPVRPTIRTNVTTPISTPVPKPAPAPVVTPTVNKPRTPTKPLTPPKRRPPPPTSIFMPPRPRVNRTAEVSKPNSSPYATQANTQSQRRGSLTTPHELIDPSRGPGHSTGLQINSAAMTGRHSTPVINKVSVARNSASSSFNTKQKRLRVV